MKQKTYRTPKRHCMIKTRLTVAERTDFEQRCSTLSMSQSEYIRQAIFYSRITPIIRVSHNSEELLTSVSSLVAQYGKIGSNLNQIARYLNEGSPPYQGLSKELREAAEAYLTFEHDEFTMKPVLDENGRLIPRTDYRMEILNCGNGDFALSCIRANIKYGKNNQREDIKSHHYIISFAPVMYRTTA